MNLVIKDAVRQILGRVASAIWGFLVIKMITPYLGPLRFGDYSTILKYFAIRSAFADFGIYVIALKQLGKLKATNWKLQAENSQEKNIQEKNIQTATHDKASIQAPLSSKRGVGGELQTKYNKFVSTRFFMIAIVYTLALTIAYLIPAYTSNPYLIWGLPIGMLFSASFMSAGILQIPLQLFWKMEQLSIGLILARIAQLSLLWLGVYVFFYQVDFSNINHPQIYPFLLILCSVLLSGIVQAVYVRWQGKKYLTLQRQRDRSFTKNILGKNRKYGLAYYLSSFHTLIVLILLSMFYPTIKWFSYAGTRALALALIEILLIIPSALGNSLIHKVSSQSRKEQKSSFGALLQVVFWIGCFVIVMFTRFAPHIIHFIGGAKYLSTANYIGSDFILPFLGIVITMSFVKQVFNYIFVSHDLQNKLLSINLIGVIIGTVIGIPLLLKYNIIGGIIMQTLLELCFMLWAIWVAWKHKVLPSISWKSIASIIVATWGLIVIHTQWWIQIPEAHELLSWIWYAFIFTLLLTWISYLWLKKVMRRL